jgi:hypothetical protein
VGSEATITINGIWLTDEEAMTVRLAMDALADILGQQLGMKADGRMAFHSRTHTAKA